MSDKSNSGGSGRGEVWVVAQLVLIAAIFLAPPSDEWPDLLRALSTLLGLIIGIVGLAVVGLSAARLGNSLTIFPRPLEDGKLTRSGIYGIVRHPMYLGVILGTLGWVVLRTSTLGLTLILVLGVLLDAKARREEIWLSEKYPDYGEYRQK